MVKNKDDDDDDKYMRKNSGRREEWDQWSLDYLDRVDGKGSDEASWAQRFLGRTRPQPASRRGATTQRQSISSRLKA